MPFRGILDLLDHVDQLLGDVEVNPTDPASLRRVLNAVKNARLGIQEIRRRIERVGQETRT